MQINEHQENLEAAKAEKVRLEGKLKLQERKLMEVPRLEEQYQRNARSVVRQQEVANTLKEIGWKKLEDEVKTLAFWKSKAKSLEDAVARQKAELDNLSNQGRLSLSRYQSLLLSYNSLKRLHPQDDLTMHAVLTGAANIASAVGGLASGSSRPTTAAAVEATGEQLPAGSFRAGDICLPPVHIMYYPSILIAVLCMFALISTQSQQLQASGVRSARRPRAPPPLAVAMPSPHPPLQQLYQLLVLRGTISVRPSLAQPVVTTTRPWTSSSTDTATKPSATATSAAPPPHTLGWATAAALALRAVQQRLLERHSRACSTRL